MRVQYLSLRRAAAICSYYQYLVGKPYDEFNEPGVVIRYVLVGPHSVILQWKFVCLLVSGLSQDEALGHFKNGRYNVLVLPEQVMDVKARGIKAKLLHDYLNDVGEDTSFERYNTKPWI